MIDRLPGNGWNRQAFVLLRSWRRKIAALARPVASQAASSIRRFCRPDTVARTLMRESRWSMALFDALDAEVVILDRHGRVLHANRLWRAFGLFHPAASATDYLELCRRASGLDPAFATLEAGVASVLTGQRREFAADMRHPVLGDARWMMVRASRVTGADPPLIVVSHEDVTELVRTREAARQSERRLRTIADSLPGLISAWDSDQRCLFANKAYEEWFGFSPDRARGVSARHVVGEALYRVSEGHVRAVLAGEPQRFERVQIHPDGSKRTMQVFYLPQLEGETVSGFLVLATDVTEFRSALDEAERTKAWVDETNRKLEILSRTDPLLGISNRRDFEERLGIEWKRAQRDGTPLSILMADVDSFKTYNDLYGHQAGDRCLRLIAQALRRLARRPTDIVARYGGEEIVVVLPDTPAAGARRLAASIERAIAALAIPHAESPHDGRVTVSIGLATVVPRAGETPLSLIAAADGALYDAKNSGRNRFVEAPAHEADKDRGTERNGHGRERELS